MKWWWAVVSLLPWVLLAQENAAIPMVTVSLPRSVNPEAVLIDYGSKGHVLSLGRVATRAGLYDYPFLATSLKLLIYMPGYQMVAREFTPEDLQAGKTFVPPLVPLPTTTVTGHLIDSAGMPMKDELLNFEYSHTEKMDYFDYADGMVQPIYIGDATTDGNGEFSIAVPSFVDDPVFQSSRSQGEFRISNGKGTRFPDPTLQPGRFAPQKTYAPLIVPKTQEGTLSGKLGKEFLRQNNLSENLGDYVRPRDTIVTGIAVQARLGNSASFNARFLPDGTFELQVPAGKYDVVLWADADSRSIPIERDVVIEENRTRILERP